MVDFWAEMTRPGPEGVLIGGLEVRRGSRVRLHPRSAGDLLGSLLDGRIGIVEGIEEDDEGRLHVAVALEDDPGRDLGEGRFPGHRFFFAPEEVEPVATADSPRTRRILVAGIGNIFLGDDGFGVEVARRLTAGPRWPGVDVIDFGIRGMDLAYALQRDYDAAVLVDAVPTGDAPGTLVVIEPEPDASEDVAEPQTHAMDPVRVLRLARSMGAVPPRVLVVGCAPGRIPDPVAGDVLVELSAPVAAAVDAAVRLVESLLEELTAEDTQAAAEPAPGPATKTPEQEVSP